MKLDINVIIEEITKSFDKEIVIDKKIKEIAKDINDFNNGVSTKGYTKDEIDALNRVLQYLHSSLQSIKKQNIDSASYVSKFNLIDTYTENIVNIVDDYKLGNNPYGYSKDEIDNLDKLLDELHYDYINNIRSGIFSAGTDKDKLSNAAYAISDLDIIIKEYQSGINSKNYTADQIDRLKSLRDKLDSFTKNYTSPTKSTSTKMIPANIFDNLNQVEKNFVDSIFKRDLNAIIDNDTKFNAELNKIRIEYSGVQSVQSKIVQLRQDHEFNYAFFSNNIPSNTDVKLLIEDVELTVSSISELLQKEKKSNKDYEKLSALLNEFNEKYISCKSYILSSNDSNNQFYLSRLESDKFRCDAAKKEVEKQKKHSTIDKRRATFKFFSFPLGLATGLLKDSFTTAFPEAKGINDKISKFNFNEFAFKHFKFLEYEEEYSNTQRGKDYWKSYNDLTFFEKVDKFKVDFKIFERLFGPFKTTFDFIQSESEGLITGGGKKK